MYHLMRLYGFRDDLLTPFIYSLWCLGRAGFHRCEDLWRISITGSWTSGVVWQRCWGETMDLWNICLTHPDESSESLRGLLSHRMRTLSGNQSTCLMLEAQLRLINNRGLVTSRGAMVLLPVTLKECRLRFLFCESCPLTCHRHRLGFILPFTSSSLGWEFPCLWLCSRRKLQSNGWLKLFWTKFCSNLKPWSKQRPSIPWGNAHQLLFSLNWGHLQMMLCRSSCSMVRSCRMSKLMENVLKRTLSYHRIKLYLDICKADWDVAIFVLDNVD